jgi:hypothetical protein
MSCTSSVTFSFRGVESKAANVSRVNISTVEPLFYTCEGTE